MRITPLASGSAGNATLVQSGGTTLLLDCGLDPDDLEQRLAAVGVAPRRIRAILLTHRHRDHIRGATAFAARHKIRIRATRLTARSIGSEARRRVQLLPVGGETAEGELRARCFPVPHDVPETVGWRLWDQRTVYGHATDLGSWDDDVVTGLSRCHALLLEFNYDPDMLASGPYSAPLRRRVASDRGHLANGQASDLLRRIAWPGLQHVFVGHVSQRNNSHALALSSARAAVAELPTTARVAYQDRPTRPFSPTTLQI